MAKNDEQKVKLVNHWFDELNMAMTYWVEWQKNDLIKKIQNAKNDLDTRHLSTKPLNDAMELKTIMNQHFEKIIYPPNEREEINL